MIGTFFDGAHQKADQYQEYKVILSSFPNCQL